MTPEMSKTSTNSPTASVRHVSVDSHFHIFKAHQSLPGTRYTPAYGAKFEDWQTRAAAAGVTHGVLVQTSFMGTDNRLTLAQLALHHETLRGVAVVAPDTDLTMLSALHAQGVRGIRLNLAGQLHDMAAWANATGLWDALLELGWHVELHTDTGRLVDIIAALPVALRLVLDHFGKPSQASAGDATVAAIRHRRRMAASGSVHVKLSGSYRLNAGLSPVELAGLWLQELGPQALLWGSDWPCTNHESRADYPALNAALTDWLGGDDRLAAQVRSTNPLGLYWDGA